MFFHHKSSQIITHHHTSSQIITHHHTSSQIITNHHKSSQIIELNGPCSSIASTTTVGNDDVRCVPRLPALAFVQLPLPSLVQPAKMMRNENSKKASPDIFGGKPHIYIIYIYIYIHIYILYIIHVIYIYTIYTCYINCVYI